MNKTYLVLSVRQINALARAVQRNRKANKGKMSHTVTLYFETVPGHTVGGREQISSNCVEGAISRLNTESHNTEFSLRRVDKAVQTV